MFRILALLILVSVILGGIYAYAITLLFEGSITIAWLTSTMGTLPWIPLWWRAYDEFRESARVAK